MSALAEHEAAQIRRASCFSRERLLQLFTSAPKAFWRHDVDISLDAAVRMARFAQVAGVQSTFYLAPRCPFYNLFSEEGWDAVWEIKRRGHRIGVHAWDELWARDAKLFNAGYRDALTQPERPLVSFHMPDENVLWQEFSRCESAYAPEWEGRYLSDSRGRPITDPVTDDMQINLHPEHWRL